MQRSDRILWRDQRYVAFGTYLNGAEFDKTDLVLEYGCRLILATIDISEIQHDCVKHITWGRMQYTVIV